MASLSQMELAAAILDIVPQMDPQVVTLSIVMDMLATHFGVDLDDIKRHRAVIKTLVVSGIQAYHGTEDEKSGSGNGDDEDGGDKENVNRSSPWKQKKRRVQENPKRRPVRRSNVISDGSDDESDDESEQEEEEGGDDGGDNHESESQQSGSDSDEAPSKIRARGKATPAKRKAASSSELDKSAKKKAASAAKKPPRQIDPPGLISLKEMARSARLLSPRIYAALKKLDSESEQEEYIRGLLRDNGIAFSGRYPQKREIDAVRRKKDMEKDLEGIDTSLIIPDDTASRSRRASRAQVSYAEQLRNRAASEDEEENDDRDTVDENTEKKSEDEEEEDDDEFAASDSSEAEF